ncbi:hypothetical protein QYE76_015624 [Lolium multiflorum]|uniref:Uncharacterized protein n=1 Tax=Lolium multiflorum TaxID=4521 RepID=A0AAD8X9D0_LOLMU|nr:hypothetical protein QYE76_015624 [Lolium multiflorum]
MEQSRKASKGEKIALQQAKEAIAAKDAAIAEAAETSSRENYMLQLMTDASLDMTVRFGSVERKTEFLVSPYLVLFGCSTKHLAIPAAKYVGLFKWLEALLEAIADDTIGFLDLSIGLRVPN